MTIGLATEEEDASLYEAEIWLVEFRLLKTGTLRPELGRVSGIAGWLYRVAVALVDP